MYLDTILEGLICCEVAGVNKILKMGGWEGGGGDPTANYGLVYKPGIQC